jgi:hypothetical protein
MSSPGIWWVSGQPITSGLKFQGMSASISYAGQLCAMRVKVWESQSSGSTPFILQVCSKVASVA